MRPYFSNPVTVAVTDALATAQEIIFSDQAGGRVYIPSGSSITSLTWYDAPEPGGTFLASYDEYGTALAQTVAAEKSYEIPVSLAGAGALKVVGDAAGTIYLAIKG